MLDTNLIILINRLKEAKTPTRRFLKVDSEKKAFEKEWQLNLYSPEELEHYPRWGICGGDGLVPLEADKLEMEDIIRSILPPTLEVVSPRRKLSHFFYIVEGEQVNNMVLHVPNDYDEKGRLRGAGEVRSQGQYFVCAGTQIRYKDLETGEEKTGIYKIRYDRPIARIQYNDFINAILPYLGDGSSSDPKKQQRITHEQMKNGVPEGTRHAQGIKYANFLVGVKEFDYTTTLSEMVNWNTKCTPPMPLKDLEKLARDATNYQNKPNVQKRYSKKPQEKNNNEEDDPKEKIEEISQLITETFIAEEIYDPPNLPQFAVKYFDKDEIEFQDTIDLGEKDAKDRAIIYHPIMNDHIKKGTVILPRKPVKCEVSEVVKEAFTFVRKNFDPCGKESELKLVIIVTLAGWFIEKEKPVKPIAGTGVFAPIIACRGPSGSGKNRLANCLRFMSYHPLLQLSTYRIPSIYRPLDFWKGTLVIDECDVKDSGETAQLIHFLNSRATGTPILRQNPESPSKCDAFDSFGMTIVTQRKHFDDNATEGRIIPFQCDVSNDKQITTMLTIEQIEKGLDLQDKLLYLRLSLWDKFKIDKKLWIDKVTDHRLNSSLLPAMGLAKFDTKLEEIIQKNVINIHEERTLVKAQSQDGQMVNFLWEKIESGLYSSHNGFFFVGSEKEETSDDQEKVNTTIIPLTTKYIEDLWGKSESTARAIRKTITGLNITPKKAPIRIKLNNKTFRPIFFDVTRMEKRLREFVVKYEKNLLAKTIGYTTLEVTKPQQTFGKKDKTPLGKSLKITLKIIKEKGMIRREDIICELKTKHEIAEKEANQLINQLAQENQIFSPKSGYLRSV